jgi:hypothetical protein
LLCPGAAARALDLERLPPAAQETVDFRRDVYPLLTARCFRCHQGTAAASGYRLDLRAEVLGETNGKPLVQLGNSGQSRLIHLVSGALADKVMPPKGERLTPDQVGVLRAWIDQGLKWDDQLLPPLASASSHWAFQPVTDPAVPRVTNAAWVRNAIDAFIAARHEAKGLPPAPEAPRRVLIRRLALDLTGLPPAPEEVEAFVTDPAPDAYERRVDRLLASPHYGERWGRHWLDVVRWAETEGYESNHLRPYAWRYRDYVVQSFNQDKPYDRFLREQLAGDELTPYADENLIATGFLAAARLSSNEEDKALQRNDILVDIVNATSSALLGLTLNCAQCHNHKFDPLTARDYYSFMGFFVKGQPANLLLRDRELWAAYQAALPAEYEPAKKLQEVLFEAARARLIAETKKTLNPEMLRALETPADRRTTEQDKLAREADLKLQFTPARIERAVRDEDRKLYDELKKKVEALEKRIPDKPQTFGFYSPATSPTRVEVLAMKGFYPLPYEPNELARTKPHLLVSGSVHRRGPEVEVAWPAVLGPTPKALVDQTPRLALADWLTGLRHPLTARVWVNRLWHYHFGRGLVATPGDFGVKGAPPTHPELLDWLAAELVRSRWSTKHLHKLIVCSSTYRQSSQHHAGNATVDPDNLLWWRWSPRRLEAEVIRDGLLAVSGELDRTLGGPGIADDGKSVRRSLYLLQKRGSPPAVQSLFDGPTAMTESCARRHVSTVPLQSLFLLNHEFTFTRAQVFAQRLLARGDNDRERLIDTAFVLALGRNPEETEREASRKFFQAHGTSAARPGEPPLDVVHFCQALLNLNELVYLE